MGFSVVLKIVGECSADAFLKKCQERCEQPTNEEKIGLKEWIKGLPNMEKFYNSVELSFDDFFVEVIDWSFKAFEGIKNISILPELEPEIYDSEPRDIILEGIGNINKYIPWIFFEILIIGDSINSTSERNSKNDIGDSIDSTSESNSKNDIDYSDYYQAFEKLEDIISIDKYEVKILICRKSSYKGGENIKIDYENIVSYIDTIKDNFGDVNVITTLELH